MLLVNKQDFILTTTSSGKFIYSKIWNFLKCIQYFPYNKIE